MKMNCALGSALLFVAVSCCAEEGKELRTNQENAIRRFVKAFFSEDKDMVLEGCSGKMNEHMAVYFWIKATLHGGKKGDELPQPWNGKIEFVAKQREKIMWTEGVIMETEEDVFKIRVDGKGYSVGLDKEKKVLLFQDWKPDGKK